MAALLPIALGGIVNAYLVETATGRLLVDTGFARTTDELLQELSAGPIDLVLATHAHVDHAGALAAVKAATGAPAAMHPADAALVRQGSGGRPLLPGPGVTPEDVEAMNARMVLEPCEIEVELADGEVVPGFPDITVVHAPGHDAGQVALLWSHDDGVLFAADAAANRGALTLSRVAEDWELTLATARRLAQLEFETAVFGHGAPIERGASEAFRAAFPPAA
jgi:glyoxylase-like metal-dependent hydrolase (beta-lactamase superfamily II)